MGRGERRQKTIYVAQSENMCLCVCVCYVCVMCLWACAVGKKEGGVFTRRQWGWLIRNSSLLANGFKERGRCHLTEKDHLPPPAHPLQCNAAMWESTAVTALSSLLCARFSLTVHRHFLSFSLISLPLFICAYGPSPCPSSLFAFFRCSFSFSLTLSHRQR